MHRFTRVIFGLMSRPCLRDTQNAFLRIVASTDTRKFYITKFLRDFCVDHLASSFNKEEKAFRFYKTLNIYFFSMEFSNYKNGIRIVNICETLSTIIQKKLSTNIAYFILLTLLIQKVRYKEKCFRTSMIFDPLGLKFSIVLQINSRRILDEGFFAN